MKTPFKYATETEILAWEWLRHTMFPNIPYWKRVVPHKIRIRKVTK